MKKASISLVVLLLLLPAALVGCSNPADDTTPATVSEPEAVTGEPVGELPAGTVYTVGSDSTVEFTGSKITGSHDGGFNSFTGEIVLVNEDPAASRVEFLIDTTSMWTDMEKLTEHLKSADFFDVVTYPEARFVSTGIAVKDDGYEVTGDLDLHGVTKKITFPALIEVTDDGIMAEAEFYILRFDFGIEFPGMPDDLIRNEVVIRLNVAAR